jgi:hypothetical protein
VHAPTEDKTDDTRNSFFEELEHVFDQFPKYYMKTLIGDQQLGMRVYLKLVMIMMLE